MGAPVHLRFGTGGEKAAAGRVLSMGWKILEKNYRVKTGEVDLICRDGDTIVFVEVKTRRAGGMAAPVDAVHARKRARLLKAASAWLSAKELWDRPCRFDVASVVERGEGFEVEILENAFGPDDVPGKGFYQPF